MESGDLLILGFTHAPLLTAHALPAQRPAQLACRESDRGQVERRPGWQGDGHLLPSRAAALRGHWRRSCAPSQPLRNATLSLLLRIPAADYELSPHYRRSDVLTAPARIAQGCLLSLTCVSTRGCQVRAALRPIVLSVALTDGENQLVGDLAVYRASRLGGHRRQPRAEAGWGRSVRCRELRPLQPRPAEPGFTGWSVRLRTAQPESGRGTSTPVPSGFVFATGCRSSRWITTVRPCPEPSVSREGAH